MVCIGDADHVTCGTVSTYDERQNAGHDGGLFHPAAGDRRARSTYSSTGRDPDFDEFDDAIRAADQTRRTAAGRGRPGPSGLDAGTTSKLPHPGGNAGFGPGAGFDGGSGLDAFDRDLGYSDDADFGPGAGYADQDLDLDGRRRTPWHGGADLGLLVLRLAVGGIFVAHGLQHLFGLFHGIGRVGFEHFLATGGYHYPHVLAYVAGGTELAGGALLALGLFTPLAAAGLLAVMANVVVLKWRLGFFLPGYEFELLLGAAAFALLFAGPGRVSLDRPTPWFRRPGVNGFVFLVISAGAAVATELLLRTR